MSTATNTRLRSSKRTTPGRTISRTSPLTRSAHELAERGFPVFPLIPRSKKPITKHGFKAATTDPKRIGPWWRKQPKANIGIATGNDLTVLDFDSEPALDYAQELGLPDTLTARSGRDGVGQHHYFSGDLPNKLKIHPDIHVQGLGAYVVAPPSVHPDTGALYEWMTDPDHPLGFVPEWALDAQEIPSETMLEEGADDSKFNEGERKVSLHKLASRMRGTGMLDEEIGSFLATANESRCLPPLEDADIRDIEKSVLGYAVGYKPDLNLLLVERMTAKPSSLAVYIAIRDACGYKDRSRVTTERLEQKTGKAHATIVAAVQDLEEARVIEAIRTQIRGRDQCNEYRLLELPEDPS